MTNLVIPKYSKQYTNVFDAVLSVMQCHCQQNFSWITRQDSHCIDTLYYLTLIIVPMDGILVHIFSFGFDISDGTPLDEH